jgi:hypothetical protein
LPDPVFAPATPQKNKTKSFYEGKNKSTSTSSRWSGPSMVRIKRDEEKLAQTAVGAVKQFHVLGTASLAGFEVIIDGRF